MSEIGRMSAISKFWAWVIEYQDDLQQVRASDDPFLDLLLTELRDIDRGLNYEICFETAPRELVITAGGQIELFSLVDDLVAAAPSLPGWRFIALKPPSGFDFETTFEGTIYDPRSMWFVPLESPSRPHELGLRIGIPGLMQSVMQSALNASYIVLETALGERAVATGIQYLDVEPLPLSPEEQGYLPLLELSDYLQWRLINRVDKEM